MTFLDPINSFVDALTPGTTITGTQGLEYLLIFFLVFSVMFAATGYTPLFKDDKYRNLRIIISITIGYMTTTFAYVALIADIMSYFGFFAAFVIGLGSVLHFILPEQQREKGRGMTIAIILGIIIVAWFFLSSTQIGFEWLNPIIEFFTENMITIIVVFIISLIMFYLFGKALNKT